MVAAQRVAHAGLALNRHPGELQVLNVAIDGALRDLQLLGQPLRRQQAAEAQKLDDAEESVGASHRCDLKAVLLLLRTG